MEKLLKKYILLSAIFSLLFSPVIILAQEDPGNINSNNPLDRVQNVAVTSGPYAPADETTVSAIAGTVVNIFLGLLGIIFIVLIILAGYKWMSASGNEEQVTKAKSQLKNAIIGLIIVLGSYAIWEFVFSKLIGQGGSGGATTVNPPIP